MQLSPNILRKLEDRIEIIAEDQLARVLARQYWRRLMMVKPLETKRHIMMWLVESLQLDNIGNGGNYVFDELVRVYHEVVAETIGKAHELSTDDVEDTDLNEFASWVRQVTNLAAIWPQDQLDRLIVFGDEIIGYDGVAHWSTAHPINPYLGASAGTYPNVHANMPFSYENLILAVKLVSALTGPNGRNRQLVPRIVVGGFENRHPIIEAMGAKTLTRDASATAITNFGENIIEKSYGFEEPIISNTLGAGAPRASEEGAWLLCCEVITGEMPGFVLGERSPLSISMFGDMNQAELAMKDTLLYKAKMRAVATTGHPYVVHKFYPGDIPEVGE